MHLRQIALVASDLDSAVAELQSTLGLGEPFADEGVATFGLHNAVFAIGETYLEVVSPNQIGTTAGRLLERRAGDGGYMVILQSQDLAEDRKRIGKLGVRVAWEVDLGDAETIHLHPRDVGGAILSLDKMDPPESWRWAGPGWESRSRTEVSSGIVGTIIQAEDPEQMATRWSEVLGIESNGLEISMGRTRLRFVPIEDGRGEGVAGFELAVNDRDFIERAAAERGLERRGSSIKICGVWIELVS